LSFSAIIGCYFGCLTGYFLVKTVLHYVSNLAYSVFLAAVFLDYAVFWSYVYILITCVNVLSLVSANAVSLGLQCIVHCDE